VRQQLAADPGPGAVRADQQVAGGRAAVGEVRRYRAVAGLLVAGELLVEVDHVVQPGQQYLAERDAADRVRAVRRVGPARLGVLLHELAELLVEHAHPLALVA
jgi:hypothetical protein